MTLYRILSFLLPILLTLTVVFNGCKSNTDDPSVMPATQPDSIQFHTLLFKLNGQQTGTKAVVVLDYREDLLKSRVKQAALSGKLIPFKQTDFLAVDLALRTVAGVLRKKGSELNAYATITDYYVAELKKVPGYEPVIQLTEAQIKSFMGQKEVIAFQKAHTAHSNVQTAGFTTLVDALLATINPFAPGVSAAGNTFSLRNFAGYVRTTFGYTGAISAGAASAIPLVGGITLATPSMTTGMASFAYSTGDPAVGNAVDELGSRGPLDWLADHFGGNNDGDSMRDFFGSGNSGGTPAPSGGLPGITGQDLLDQLEGDKGGATSHGEPHLITHDQVKYDFQAVGEFIAVKSSTDKFELQVRYTDNGERSVSYNKAFALNTGADIISFEPGKTYLYLNKQRVELAQITGNYALPGGGSIKKSGSVLFITTPANDKITMLSHFVYCRAANSRKGKLSGLFGNFDDDKSNDGRTRDNKEVNLRQYAELYPTYANSWRISQAESLFFYENGATTETYTDRSKPQKARPLDDVSLARRQQAEAVCRQAGVTREPELCNCILDVAISGETGFADIAALIAKTKPTSSNFLVMANYPGKSGDGAVTLAVGNRIFAGLGSGQSNWYEYDPAADKWTKRADFAGSSSGIYGAAPFVIGQKIYLAGGVNASDFKVVNWLWEYDAAADKWTKRKDVPGAARANMAGFAANGKGHVVFGANGGGSSEADYPERSATYQYDPATDAWTKQADYPGGARGANFTNKEYNGIGLTINGRPFVGGGTGTGFRDWYEYKPATSTWEKRADSPASVGFYQMAVGNVGYFVTPGSKSYWQYNAATNTWTEQTDFYFPRTTTTGTRLAAVVNGRAYFGLGRDTEQWWSFTP